MFATGDGFHLRLPDALASRARSAGERRVALGLRPSDLEYTPDAAPDAAFDLNVLISEYVGAQSVLICGCGGARMTVEIKSETPIALGETLRFAARPEGLHLFNQTTERAL